MISGIIHFGGLSWRQRFVMLCSGTLCPSSKKYGVELHFDTLLCFGLTILRTYRNAPLGGGRHKFHKIYKGMSKEPTFVPANRVRLRVLRVSMRGKAVSPLCYPHSETGMVYKCS